MPCSVRRRRECGHHAAPSSAHVVQSPTQLIGLSVASPPHAPCRRGPAARGTCLAIPPQPACSSFRWGSITQGDSNETLATRRRPGRRRGVRHSARRRCTAALATTLPSDRLVVIVNYDETVTTSDAMSTAIMNVGSGVIQFNNLDLVAAFATPAEITAIRALPGVQGVYANKQLRYSAMLHESIPTIRADAVHASGITGKGVGIAILDSGIDGLYNPDLHYPDKTVQNIKVLFNLTDLFTFKGSLKKPAKGANLFVENLPNSETSVGHGTHVAGIAAGLGTASGGYYTGVAPGAKLIGIGTGDVLFIFWALAGFDYILDHQQAYNIKVVNNSWGTSGPFDPKDPINEASKKVSSKG